MRHYGAVASTFPHARRSEQGYDPDEVDEFLDRARRAYTGTDATAKLTATGIRRTAFTIRKGGYSARDVDAALERLEDAFATRERTAVIAERGDTAWYRDARSTAQEILDRLVRPQRHRFRRVGPFAVGYDPHDVDPLCDRISAYLQTGAALAPEEVRTAAFRPKRGGYSEAQVDFLLDAAIAVMLAVR